MPNPDAAGVVGMHLNLVNGATLTSLDWVISDGTHAYTGTVAVGGAQSVEFVASGIAAGTGYVATLSGADSDGDPCSGVSSSFAVTAGATTAAALLVTCTVPADAEIPAEIESGSVAVDAGISLVDQAPFGCPAIEGIAISPAELYGTERAALGSVSTPATGGTETLQWSATCSNGTPTLTNPNSANAAFACGSALGATCAVTLQVGLLGTGVDGGSVGQVCSGIANTSITETVYCEPQCTTAAACPASTTVCAAPACNAGACGFAPAPEGTPCTDSGGTVCNGAGSCVPFTFEVVRLGGVADAGLTGAAAPVFVEKRLVSDGGLVGTPVALPTAPPDAGQNAFTLPGLDPAVGLSRSADGHCLTLAGYAQTVGGALQVGSTVNTAVPVVVARIDALGNVDTSTAFSSASGAFMTANYVRGAATADGGAFWVSGLGNTVDGGNSGGVWFLPFGTGGGVDSQVASTAVRIVGIAGGQLYASGDTEAAEVFQIGSGLPEGPAPVTALPGLPMAGADAGGGGEVSPWQFVLLQVHPTSSGPDTLYIANDLVGSSGSASAFLARYSLDGGSWVQTATLTTSAPDGGPGPGFRGVAGLVVGSRVTLIATTAEASNNRVIVFTDDGVSSPWAGTSQTVAVANDGKMYFRGVALSPH